MKLHVGTSGYSYKEWKGAFYPEDLPASDMLGYYASRLGAVEINNTFYRMPSASVLEKWADAVPEGFRFSVKASMKITHRRRLKGADEEMDYLTRTVRTLGARLGVLLFQLPPNFKRDVERLASFLELIPADVPAAFEFRHDSWRDDEVNDVLRGRGVALCCADTDDSDEDEPIVSTAPWGYLRLRRADYAAADLARWRTAVAAQDWSHAFVFFKHEDEAAGPRMAADFVELPG